MDLGLAVLNALLMVYVWMAPAFVNFHFQAKLAINVRLEVNFIEMDSEYNFNIEYLILSMLLVFAMGKITFETNLGILLLIGLKLAYDNLCKSKGVREKYDDMEHHNISF